MISPDEATLKSSMPKEQGKEYSRRGGGRRIASQYVECHSMGGGQMLADHRLRFDPNDWN